MRQNVCNARASNSNKSRKMTSVPLRADSKGTELPSANILIQKAIDCATTLPLTIFI